MLNREFTTEQWEEIIKGLKIKRQFLKKDQRKDPQGFADAPKFEKLIIIEGLIEEIELCLKQN